MSGAAYSIDSFAESSNSHLAVDRSLAFGSRLSPKEQQELFHDLFDQDDALLTLGGPTFSLPLTQTSPSELPPTLKLHQLLEQPEVDEEEEHSTRKLSSRLEDRSVMRYPYNARGKISVVKQSDSALDQFDLHELFKNPRPDVLQYYPASPKTPRSDYRVEEDLTGQQQHRHGVRFLAPSKKAKPDGRLSHLESIYGVAKLDEPRKSSNGTFIRLANPIHGYNSTLEALSPEQRRRREEAAKPSKASDRMARSTLIGPGKAKTRKKGTASSPPHGKNTSKNQSEDVRFSKKTMTKSLETRMVELREKMLKGSTVREPKPPLPIAKPTRPTMQKPHVSTFLTQEEDKELSLYERIERLPRPPAEVVPNAPSVRRPSRVKPQVNKKTTKPSRPTRATKSTASTRAKTKQPVVVGSKPLTTRKSDDPRAGAELKRVARKPIAGASRPTTTATHATTSTNARRVRGLHKKTKAIKAPASILDKQTSDFLCSELLLMGGNGAEALILNDPPGCVGAKGTMPLVAKPAPPSRPSQVASESNAPKRPTVRFAIPTEEDPGRSKVRAAATKVKPAPGSARIQLPVL